nr:type II secretion system secretin GspD [Desulfobacteraceae bacterium]
MRARRLVAGLAAIAMLLTWGCARKTEGTRTWADLAEINEQVAKMKEARPAPVEGGMPAEEEATPKGPRVKVLSAKPDGHNPLLEKISPEKAAPKEKTTEGILLNFDNADIYEVIRVIGETLNLDYIIDPRVKGVVNIRTSKPIPKSELLAVFRKLLNINGLDIVPEGDRYYIYPTANPGVQKVYSPTQVDKLGHSSKVVMQVVPLMYLSSAEALDLITPYLSEQGLTYNLADQNVLIISDFETMVADIVQILSYLDVSPLTNLSMRLVRIENTPLFDLNDDLTQILSAMHLNKGGEKGFDSITVLPLERVNSLLLISKSDYLMDNVQKWIEELDVTPAGGKDNVFFYSVRNSVASDLAQLVNNVLSEQPGQAKEKKRPTLPGGPQAQATKPGATGQTAGKTEKKPLSTVQLAGGPILIADDDRNIILIRAMPADYRRIVKLLERLDTMPRQVLIEVMVAEVTLTDKLNFGVEWALQNGATINGTDYSQLIRSANITTTGYVNPATGLPQLQGLSYTLFTGTNDVRALINALADNTHVSILSSPQILVLNNEPASINVGNQVPIVTNTITSAESATAANQTTLASSIQYKDTGVILNVTPRINFNGIITLEVDQQVSNVGATGVAGSPEIFNRELKTKLAVKDGQSIMIGGLISKDSSVQDTGIPFLKDIPVLGYAFKSHNQNSTKTELLVMITPYVIESEDVLQQYFKTFKEKMSEMRSELAGKPQSKAEPHSKSQPQPQPQPQPQVQSQPPAQAQPQPEVLPWSPRQPPPAPAQPQPGPPQV